MDFSGFYQRLLFGFLSPKWAILMELLGLNFIKLIKIFIAQALDIELTFTQQLALFATAMLSSKGAAGVTGAGFITLAATLSVVLRILPSALC